MVLPSAGSSDTTGSPTSPSNASGLPTPPAPATCLVALDDRVQGYLENLVEDGQGA